LATFSTSLHAKEVPAPEFADLFFGVAAPHQFESDVESFGGPVPAIDASTTVKIGRDSDNAKEREQALAEIARVLKPGGHAAIFDVRHGYAPFFERNGFTIMKKWMTMIFGRSVVARKK
jgi:hypothetical protein